MLNTRKLKDNAVLVSFEPTEILIRKSGKAEFGKEESLVSITDDTILIDKKTAKKFGLTIKMA